MKGVFGLVPVAKYRAADPQHHRTVPRDECGKGQLGRLVVFAAPGRKPLEKLAIGQPDERAGTEQG